MEFCKQCDNMYYMKTNEDKKLIYYCKCCGFEDDNMDITNLKVSKYSKNVKLLDINVNEYTKYDATLPHVSTIKCPNSECRSNKEQDVNNDVIYIRYDNKNMKYMYLCYHCDYVWKP